MKLSLKRSVPINLSEIHDYADDLQRVTMLRSKSTNTEEIARYDTMIEVMQLVMIELNTLKEAK